MKVPRFIKYKFVEQINKKILCNEVNLIDVKGIEYFRNEIFSSLLIILLIFASPIYIWDLRMFLKEGNILGITSDIVLLSVHIILFRTNLIYGKARKLIAVSTIYITGIFLIIVMGSSGSGMVLILFSMIFTGFILDKKDSIKILFINILIFIVLTLLLFNGYLDEAPIQSYKSTWIINVIVVQFCGIISFTLMDLIFEGLKKQADFIKQANIKISQSEKRYKSMIVNISDVIIIIDEEGIVKYVSENIYKIYGWKQEELLDKSIFNNINYKDKDNLKYEFKLFVKKQKNEEKIEMIYKCKNGDLKNVEVTARNLVCDLNIGGILINYHDITERRIHEKEIIYISHHDTLTGLYNRTFFEKQKKMIDCKENLPISFISADIDGLKIINDSLGHLEGDKLIKTIAEIIQSCCRKEDIVARVGGDEFYILLPNTNSEASDRIIKKITLKCEEYNKNNLYEAHYLSVSLGSATKIKIEDSLDDVLKLADDIMYRNKNFKKKDLDNHPIFLMQRILFSKIPDLEEKGNRLEKLSRKLGEALGLSNENLEELELLANMIDIGKIGIDDKILKKTTKLTKEELEEMEKHSEIGYRIAKSSSELVSIAECIFAHHEEWDGKGYPQGLSGEDIPLISRIISIVEFYDNMAQSRDDNGEMIEEDIIQKIIKKSGSKFDPAIVKVFIEVISGTCIK